MKVKIKWSWQIIFIAEYDSLYKRKSYKQNITVFKLGFFDAGEAVKLFWNCSISRSISLDGTRKLIFRFWLWLWKKMSGLLSYILYHAWVDGAALGFPALPLFDLLDPEVLFELVHARELSFDRIFMPI
jgi:hypothetical protein